MTTTSDNPQSLPPAAITFAYMAQTLDGRPMSGTIEAASLEDASRRLSDLNLRVISLAPASRPPRAKPLGGEDFAAFNQQLAHLASAGLPIEQGLRLIAEDLRDGGLAQSVRDVAAELERGVSLGEAFRRHARQFPPLYGAIVEAGVRAGNLPAVLLNLGRHLELVARLRAALWQAAAYPLTVLAGLVVVLIFLGHYVLPLFARMYRDLHVQLPGITRGMLGLTDATPWIALLAIVLFVGSPLLWAILRAARLDRAAADLALPLPLVGPILHKNLIARWCDAMKLAIEAGMDLPGAVSLACDIIASPALKRDTSRILAQLESGRRLDELPAGATRILAAPVLSVVQLAADGNHLPESLQTLATMYRQQAELRLGSIQAVLAPTLILLLALLIGLVVIGLFAPIISLFNVFS
ncbi:type II secretion system F family protein [Fontivita pretiosa]|uniref:type II secretion system F family protein n=1 Tax=Fontivita pretiosa TaxID=2989684 RepID=UPI003D1845FE